MLNINLYHLSMHSRANQRRELLQQMSPEGVKVVEQRRELLLRGGERPPSPDGSSVSSPAAADTRGGRIQWKVGKYICVRSVVTGIIKCCWNRLSLVATADADKTCFGVKTDLLQEKEL